MQCTSSDGWFEKMAAVCLKSGLAQAGAVTPPTFPSQWLSDGMWVMCSLQSGCSMSSVQRGSYVWRFSDGVVANVDHEFGQRLCDQLVGRGGGLLLVGDSVSHQHFDGLATLLRGQANASLRSSLWPTRTASAQLSAALSSLQLQSVCNGKAILAFQRNDWLETSPSYGVRRSDTSITNAQGMKLWRCETGTERTEHNIVNSTAACAPWAIRELLAPFRVIVTNSGAHHVPDEDYRTLMRLAATKLSAHATSTGAIALFRTTVPGFSNCSKYAAARPHATLQAAEDFLQAHPFHNQQAFVRGHNAISVEEFVANGLGVIDAYSPSVLRVDDRRAYGNDCLHYPTRHPQQQHSSMTHWTYLLGAVLDKTLPAAPPANGTNRLGLV